MPDLDDFLVGNLNPIGLLRLGRADLFLGDDGWSGICVVIPGQEMRENYVYPFVHDDSCVDTDSGFDGCPAAQGDYILLYFGNGLDKLPTLAFNLSGRRPLKESGKSIYLYPREKGDCNSLSGEDYRNPF